MKSSSASLFGVVVAILTLISAVLLVTSESYGTALLAIALGGGVAVLLFTAQNIVSHLEELRHDMETLRGDSNKSSSFETSLRELKTEISKLSESASVALRTLPTPNTPLSSNIGAATTALSPPSTPFTPPEPPPSISSLKKDSYQPLGDSLSSSSSSPLSSAQQNLNQNLGSKFPSLSNDPNRTNASFAVPKSLTSSNTAVSHTGSHDSMETTQSFLPHIPSNHSEKLQEESKPTTLSTQDTVGFESSSLPTAEPTRAIYSDPLKPPSKTHSKIKKRYSTFAGLSLSEDTPEANKYRETILTPPPPPPPPNKIEKKRYSTFAGLALGERNRISPPSSPSPSSIPSSASQGNPLSILSP
ncbi:MAG: proteophosphoglycan 5, partial [bacterium]